MRYYLDTSARAKIYHRESGTDTMLGLYTGSQGIQISELARLELLAVTTRKLREGLLNVKAHEALLQRFEEDTQHRFDTLGFSSLIVEETARVLGTLGTEHPLRTLDAIQFAFYSVHCENETVFVCSDQRLLAVVSQEGYPTFNPQPVG